MSQKSKMHRTHKSEADEGTVLCAVPTNAVPPLTGEPVLPAAGSAGCALGLCCQEQRELSMDRNSGSQKTFAFAPKPSRAFARPAKVGEPASAAEMSRLPRRKAQPERGTVSASLPSDRRSAGSVTEPNPQMPRADETAQGGIAGFTREKQCRREDFDLIC